MKYREVWTAAQEGYAGAVCAALRQTSFAPVQVSSMIAVAAWNDHPEVIAALLSYGHLDARLENASAALMMAARRGNADVAISMSAIACERSRCNAVCEAANHGHLVVVQALLARHGPALLQHDTGPAALTGAARHGHAEVVTLLLRSKANAERATLPKSAITSADANTLGELVAAGMDVDSTLWCSEVFRTISLLGRSLNTPRAVAVLLRAKATLHDDDIHQAIQHNGASAHEVVSLLLSAKGDANAVCGERREPLLVAAGRVFRGDVATVLLHAKANPGATNRRGTPVLNLVTRSIRRKYPQSGTDVLSLLLRAKADANSRDPHCVGATALHCATVEAAAVCLLGAKADPLCTDYQGRSALHIIAKGQNYARMRAHERELMSPACVQVLLDAKVSPSTTDLRGRTALHTWVHGVFAYRITLGWAHNALGQQIHMIRQQCDNTVVGLLIGSKADVNAADGNGKTALHHAVGVYGDEFGRDYCRCVKVLLGAHADPTIANLDGKTALQQLLNHAEMGDGGRTAVACLLVSANACVDTAATNGGNTALHQAACVKDRLERAHFIQVLLDAQADPGRANATGQTPLHMLLRNEGRNGDFNVAAVRSLLDAKAGVRGCDQNGRTVLHEMATVSDIGGDFQTVLSLLMDAKADGAATKNDGRTALGTLVRCLHGDRGPTACLCCDERVLAFAAATGLRVDVQSLLGTCDCGAAKRSRVHSTDDDEDDEDEGDDEA